MNNIRAVIIDDERRSREALKKLVENYASGVEIVDVADDVLTGVELIRKVDPQLVFLDIKMKTGTGFDLLEKIENHEFHVIFTTAYDQYAINAFRFNALDYLLKPIGIDELVTAIQKAKNAIDDHMGSVQFKELLLQLNKFDEQNPTITISTESSIEFIDIDQIMYIQAQGSYCTFYLHEKKNITASRLLKEFENLLKEYRFFRVHNSYMVNLAFVQRYIKTDGGYIEMSNGDKIPVSRRKKEQFVKSFS